MARKPIIGALLLVAVGVVLGTTVFRDDIAQATGLAPAPSSVVVVNTAAQAVPTREQNLDSAGNINVAVAPSYIVKSGGGSLTCTTNDSPCPVVTGGVVATGLSISMSSGVSALLFESATPPPASPGVADVFVGPASGGVAALSFAAPYPLGFNQIACEGATDNVCHVAWAGSSH